MCKAAWKTPGRLNPNSAGEHPTPKPLNPLSKGNEIDVDAAAEIRAGIPSRYLSIYLSIYLAS